MTHLELITKQFGCRFLVPMNEVAPLLGWNPQGVRNSMSHGTCPLPIRKVGGKLMVSVVELAHWLDGDRPPQPEQPKTIAAAEPQPIQKIKRGRGRPRKSTPSVRE